MEFAIWDKTGRKDRAILRQQPMLSVFKTTKDVHDYISRQIDIALER